MYYGCAMQRTTIMLPSDLKLQAQRLAMRLGISFGELVREALQSRLVSSADEIRDDDPLFRYEVFDDDGATDLAAAHDDELYGTE
jgi:hypothetical protein